MTSFDLTGRTAVVTGAARGIGSAIATGLGAAGARLVTIDRPGVDAAGPAHYAYDLADVEGLGALADRIRAEQGPIDILVNNAGVARIDHATEIDVPTWRTIMAVNTDAVFFLSQRFGAHMIRDGRPGRIITITSKNAIQAEAGLAHYNASKAAAAMVMQSLAAEFGPYGITANAVAPGMIETPLNEDLDIDLAGLVDAWKERIPARQGFGAPDDVVGAVLLLASAAGRYINGAQLVVDGGVLADQMPRQRFMRPWHNPVDPVT